MDPAWIAALAALIAAALLLAFVYRRRRPRALPAPRAAARRPTVAGALESTRRRLGERLQAVLGRPPSDLDAVLSQLEEALVSADVGVRVASELIERLRRRLGSAAGGETVRASLGQELQELLTGPPPAVPTTRPWVVLVTGVNGVGKTTTVGRLAAMHRAAGRRVLIVAADTFRAAAAEQLAIWAERTGAGLVRQAAGADPSAVVFDGIRAAIARGVDVVLVDTAGRLHTRTNLMEELRKVQRIIAREIPDGPHEVLLVVDATTGQNAVAQARVFTEALGVTGLVLTKLDGTARGGVAVAVRRELDAPIAYVGVGEGEDDLRRFDAREFVTALLAPDETEDRAHSLTRDTRGN